MIDSTNRFNNLKYDIPKNSASMYMKQKTDRFEMRDKSIIRVGDFNTLLLVLNRTSIQKIGKDTGELHNTINQLI